MPPILFSTIKRLALSMRSRRSLSVIGWMPSVIGRTSEMAFGTGGDWPRAIAAAPTVARNCLRSTIMLIRLPDDLDELIDTVTSYGHVETAESLSPRCC